MAALRGIRFCLSDDPATIGTAAAQEGNRNRWPGLKT
jgi:hypothetical protein